MIELGAEMVTCFKEHFFTWKRNWQKNGGYLADIFFLFILRKLIASPFNYSFWILSSDFFRAIYPEVGFILTKSFMHGIWFTLFQSVCPLFFPPPPSFLYSTDLPFTLFIFDWYFLHMKWIYHSEGNSQFLFAFVCFVNYTIQAFK